ncbi:MAG TPA: ComEC/Rec2 family competence protein, partial [Actinomycetota bacterium]|nr:ComEC/Rec2 family competence protein [Actinomycetota bacterium]
MAGALATMPGSLARLWLAVASAASGALVGLGDAPVLGAWVVMAAGGSLLALRRQRTAVLIGLALLCASVSWVLAGMQTHEDPALALLGTSVPRCSFAGHVLEQAGGLGTLAEIHARDCTPPGAAGGVMILDEGEGLASGAPISGEGWLLPLGRDGFDRARRNLGAQVLLDPIELHVDPPRSTVLGLAHVMRSGLKRSVEGLGEQEGALLLGLTIGDTSRFDPEVTEAFRRSGLAHLLAVSGSNVALVLASIALALRRFSRRTRVVGGACTLCLYVSLVGPDASVLRAALMGGVTLVAVGWAGRV